MIRHIVAWNLLEGQEDAAAKIKTDLEALKDQLDYLRSIQVYVNTLESSSRSLVLETTFDNEDDLRRYAVAPEHLKCVDFIKTVTEGRIALDFQE